MTQTNKEVVFDLPINPDPHVVYVLGPKNFSYEYYLERTDRNIGWITKEQQLSLLGKRVGIAGCGGMGGAIALHLQRCGIGHIVIGDPDVFDISNLNRQVGAKIRSIGQSKALVTAEEMRSIASDTTVTVYQAGVNEDTIDDFLEGLDCVIDMIEYFSVGARLLLHQKAKEKGIPLVNCNTVGFGTFFLFFDYSGPQLSEYFGFQTEEGFTLQNKIINGSATPAERQRVIDAVNRVFLPMIPNYGGIHGYDTCAAFINRLVLENKASIIATNPGMAAGLGANRILLHLIDPTLTAYRDIHPLPVFPNYFHFDSAFWKTEIGLLQRPIETKEAIEICLAEGDLLQKVFTLRCRVYTEELGSFKEGEFPDGIERDAYDDYSVHIAACYKGEVVGTLRLIKGPGTFVMEEVFEVVGFDRHTTVEHSRGIVRKDFRGLSIYSRMLDFAYAWQRQNGYMTCIGAPNVQKLFPILQKANWQINGEIKKYHNIQVVPMYYILS